MVCSPHSSAANHATACAIKQDFHAAHGVMKKILLTLTKAAGECHAVCQSTVCKLLICFLGSSMYHKRQAAAHFIHCQTHRLEHISVQGVLLQ